MEINNRGRVSESESAGRGPWGWYGGTMRRRWRRRNRGRKIGLFRWAYRVSNIASCITESGWRGADVRSIFAPSCHRLRLSTRTIFVRANLSYSAFAAKCISRAASIIRIYVYLCSMISPLVNSTKPCTFSPLNILISTGQDNDD